MFLSFEKGVKIKSIGHFLPTEVINNEKLLENKNLPITSEWIKKRVGVETRHKISDDMTNSDMAVNACKSAIEKSNIKVQDIELIILSTISPDNPNPSTACAVQNKLGISETLCPSFDISAACSGFIYALDIGSRNILTGLNNVLIVSSEVRSRFINPKDPVTYPIFGDGAGAVILEPCEKGKGFIGIEIMSDGRGYKSVHIPAGGSSKPATIETVENGEHFIKMENGEKIFFEVVEGMTKYTLKFLEKCGYSIDDIDFVIPHQANLYILKEVAKRLNIDSEKMLINLNRVGNTSSASIPIALSEFTENNTIKPNSLVFMVAVGAGHTMGLALMRT
ncbi:MAG: ketoacyl-ACP synthase III [Candidatus Sericytochromatia bacterium]